MTDLIACLSLGKGTWKEVNDLINSEHFENIYLITNNIVKDKIDIKKDNVFVIIIDPRKEISSIVEEIHKNLKDRIKNLEVAVNISSGIGKEHMAIFSAVMKLGIGMRQVLWRDGQLKEI